MRTGVAIIGLAALASGCAAAIEDRVRTRLTEAGIPPAMAGCMAEIWTDRLSVAQMQRIAAEAEQIERATRERAVARLIERVARFNDPEAVEVVTVSAARCALGI